MENPVKPILSENNQSNYLTEPDVAAILAVNLETVRLWRKTKGIPYIRLSHRCIRFRRADIDEWMTRQRVATVA